MSLHFMQNIVAANGITVGLCRDCGFYHQAPLPTQESIDAYYNSDRFYKEHSPKNWFEKEVKEHEAGYWQAYYDFKCELLGIESYVPNKTLLDVGCGSGYFVERVNELAGWGIAHGFEPSQIARDVLKSEFVTEQPPAKHLGNVHLSLVLEHLVDPRAELLKWHEYLPFYGKIMIVVPNDFSKLQKEVGGYGFISPVHINYFTPEALYGLLESCGFRVTETAATFPMELFILTGYDYRGNDKLGKACHTLRLRLEKLFGKRIFRLYQWLFHKFGWGRELIFVAEKV